MAQKTLEVDVVEKPDHGFQQVEHCFLTASQIQHQFETLRDLNEEEIAVLNKKVVRKIDWRLMPCITVMFLMKYIPLVPSILPMVISG
jgi:hypothetical protein